MEQEEKIVQTIVERFPSLEDHVNIQRRRRIIVDVLTRHNFEELFTFVTQEAAFTTFHLIIGVDDGDDLGFIYVLSNADHIILLLKQFAPKANPVIKSVCDIFPNALWHERELVDLFGAVVEGLPPGPTYPLPDGWPADNYPMRKEWKVEYFDPNTMAYNPPQQTEEQDEQTVNGGNNE